MESKDTYPATETARRDIQARIQGGSRLQLDKLDDLELSAAREMILAGEAEIISEACKPFVVAKLDRIVVP